jgi:hypothetical protein
MQILTQVLLYQNFQKFLVISDFEISNIPCIYECVTVTYPDHAEFATASETTYEEMYKILSENARQIVQAIRNID